MGRFIVNTCGKGLGRLCVCMCICEETVEFSFVVFEQEVFLYHPNAGV